MPGISEKEKQVAQEPDTTLVKAAIAGDSDSFTQLARYYYPAIVAIAHSILGNRDSAEDAAQLAFARAAVKLPQLKDNKKFAGWLAVICRNAAKDMARRQKGPDASDGYTKVVNKPEKDNSKEAVKAALKKLSDSAREIIYLRYYDGLSYEQISSVLGISEQAINGRLRRAKKKMAEYLRRQDLGQVQ
jgi:RNA polymerase sigma-70 factor (ECF subfamily)